MRNLFFLIIVSVPFLFSSCAGNPFPEHIFGKKNVFKVWLLSDIQPTNRKHRHAFEKAVADMNSKTKGIDMALVAGDIVNSAEEKVFDWYIAEREKSYIPIWHEIAGNHDIKPDLGKLYGRKIGRFHNFFRYGNILFILMSDEARGKSTTITDKTFLWWKNLVESNRDKIIIVVTHAPLEGSSIIFSRLKDRKILRSERFVEVLKKEKIDLWISGHLHLPHFFPRTIMHRKNLNGAMFVHVSSIRPEVNGLKHSESRFIAFYCGTSKASLFSRNHKKGKWQNRHTKHFELSKTIECPSKKTSNGGFVLGFANTLQNNIHNSFVKTQRLGDRVFHTGEFSRGNSGHRRYVKTGMFARN